MNPETTMSFNNNNNNSGRGHLHSPATNTNLYVGHGMTPYYFPQPHFNVSGCYYYNYPPPPHSPNSPGNGFFPTPHNMMRNGQHPHLPHPFMMAMHPRHPHPHMAMQQQQQMYHLHQQQSSSMNLSLDAPPQKRNHHRRRHNKTKCKWTFYSFAMFANSAFCKCLYLLLCVELCYS